MTEKLQADVNKAEKRFLCGVALIQCIIHIGEKIIFEIIKPKTDFMHLLGVT